MGHRYTRNHLDLEAVFGPRLRELQSQALAAGLGSSGPVRSRATVFSLKRYSICKRMASRSSFFLVEVLGRPGKPSQL